MAVKRTGQLSLVEALLGGKTVVGGCSPLDRLAGLVKWYRFDRLLAPLRDGGPGRPAWPPLVLFRALLLQSLYGLSDRELEEALGDRLSLRRARPGGDDPRPHGFEPLPQPFDRRRSHREAVCRVGSAAGEGRRDVEAWHHAGRHADRSGVGATVRRTSLQRSGCALRRCQRQGWLHLRLQGPCRGR